MVGCAPGQVNASPALNSPEHHGYGGQSEDTQSPVLLFRPGCPVLVVPHFGTTGRGGSTARTARTLSSPNSPPCLSKKRRDEGGAPGKLYSSPVLAFEVRGVPPGCALGQVNVSSDQGAPSSSFRTLERQGGEVRPTVRPRPSLTKFPTLSLQKTERRGWGTQEALLFTCPHLRSPRSDARRPLYLLAWGQSVP